tara:strand:+ start:777 stop:965 length:189 start_codon:yes stop_codon:yes gene_type:complete
LKYLFFIYLECLLICGCRVLKYLKFAGMMPIIFYAGGVAGQDIKSKRKPGYPAFFVLDAGDG